MYGYCVQFNEHGQVCHAPPAPIEAATTVAVAAPVNDQLWKCEYSDGFVRASNIPPLSTFGSVYTGRNFSGSTTSISEMQFNFAIPHDYTPGTGVYFRVFWTVGATSSGAAQLNIDYAIARGFAQASLPAALTTFAPRQQISMNIPALQIMTTDFGPIASTDLEPGAMFIVRFYRDANVYADTSPGSIFMLKGALVYNATSGTANHRPPF